MSTTTCTPYTRRCSASLHSRGAVVRLELTLLGVGAMNSPRFAPAGLLVVAPRGRGRAPIRIAIDGGDGADPGGPLDAWLVTDARAELIASIKRRARALGVEPVVGSFEEGDLAIIPRSVRHTSHPTRAYDLRWRGRRVVWAPEFWRVPRWVAGADVFFADAAGWSRPIAFAGGVGGHAAALAVAERAPALGVKRLVFVHIGRPTIRAIDAGQRPPFGEFGRDGETFRMTPSTRARAPDRPLLRRAARDTRNRAR